MDSGQFRLNSVHICKWRVTFKSHGGKQVSCAACPPPFPPYPRPAAELRETATQGAAHCFAMGCFWISGCFDRIPQRTGQIRSSILSKVEARAPGKQLHYRDLFEFFYHWLVKKSPCAPVARAWCYESDISFFSHVVQDKALLGLNLSFLTDRPQIVSALRDHTKELMQNLETHRLTINIVAI